MVIKSRKAVSAHNRGKEQPAKQISPENRRHSGGVQ